MKQLRLLSKMIYLKRKINTVFDQRQKGLTKSVNRLQIKLSKFYLILSLFKHNQKHFQSSFVIIINDKILVNRFIIKTQPMIGQQPATLWQFQPFKISSIFLILFICIVIILTALTRTSVCNKYDCYQFGSSYDRQCYSLSTIYCCNYFYLFCGDAYCIPIQHNANTYGNDCEGMLIALWVFLALCGLAIFAMIAAGYTFKKKIDAEIQLAHRSSDYVPPAQSPNILSNRANISSNQLASQQAEQRGGDNAGVRRQSGPMFNLQNQVLLL